LDELLVVREFINAIGDESKPAWVAFVKAGSHVAERDEEHARTQVEAFKKGLNQGSKPAAAVVDPKTNKEPM
jgi:hypothetical protein